MEIGFMAFQERMNLSSIHLRYYDGFFFFPMACEYIRSTGMIRQELERILEVLKKEKGA